MWSVKMHQAQGQFPGSCLRLTNKGFWKTGQDLANTVTTQQ